jgi:glycosyltransferase involved in cell wall biosynthesis
MKEGGIFTILDNCLQQIALYNKEDEYKIIALVGDKSKFEYTNIEFLEFPKSKKNWLFRLYYEYYYFRKLSLKIQPDIWLSLHDMTPNVVCKNQFVYCHHPTIFYKPSFKDWKFDYKIGVFSIFYKYLQQINIRKNKAVFVQQFWIKNEFEKLYKIKNVVVCIPEFTAEITTEKIILDQNKVHFFYPSFPRSFKNLEIIFEAIDLLDKQVADKITFHLTLDKKNTDKYSKYLFEKYKDSETINFTGILSKSEISKYYKAINCLIFPSKLETWGLPITEAKAFEKTMLLANLPYAKETVGDYKEVSFFDVNNPQELATLITSFVEKKIVYQGNKNQFETKDQLKDWFELFDYMLQS